MPIDAFGAPAHDSVRWASAAVSFSRWRSWRAHRRARIRAARTAEVGEAPAAREQPGEAPAARAAAPEARRGAPELPVAVPESLAQRAERPRPAVQRGRADRSTARPCSKTIRSR